jgi:hypothetical protein
MTTRPLRSDAMNGNTGGGRGRWRAAALAAGAAVAVLATACGSSAPATGQPALGGSVTFAQEVALARCMRGHGAPDFPDPSASGGFSLTTTPNGPRGSVDIDSSQIQAAYGACRHLLAGGGPSVAELQQRVQEGQQRREQDLPALVRFAQCMRRHGVPDFPDPAGSGQATPAPAKGAGINATSAQVQAALRACHQLLPPGMQVSVGTARTHN